MQQSRFARLSAVATIEFVEAFGERRLELAVDGTFPILRCRTYLYLSNVGGRDAAIVSVQAAAAIMPVFHGVKPSLPTVNISEPIGLDYLTGSEAAAFHAFYIHNAERSDDSGSLQDEIGEALSRNLQRYENPFDDPDNIRSAVQVLALRLVASNIYDESAVRTLPMVLPSGATTLVVVESLFFQFHEGADVLRSVEVTQRFTLGFSGAQPLTLTMECKDSYRLQRADL